MTYSLMHTAAMLREHGGFPAYGNQRDRWEAGTHFGWDNPEYR